MRVFNLVVLVVLLALIIGSDVLAGKDVKIIWVHKKEGKVEPVREKPFFGIMMDAVKDIGVDNSVAGSRASCLAGAVNSYVAYAARL